MGDPPCGGRFVGDTVGGRFVGNTGGGRFVGDTGGGIKYMETFSRPVEKWSDSVKGRVGPLTNLGAVLSSLRSPRLLGSANCHRSSSTHR